jgi:hypothetical protein
MGRLIVVQFITLDGVVEDPDGSDQTAFGGWAMRYGPQGVAGDNFSTLWPHRDDPFSRAMNAADKAVVTSREIDEETWSNSRTVDQPLPAWVRHRLATTDLVVIGSHSVVDELAEADLVDEYRLLTFPTAVGAGRRLFTDSRMLELVSAEQVGPAVLSVLTARGA